MESQHYYLTLDLLDILLVMNGYASKPPWLCGLDYDLHNDAGSVLLQPQELDKVVRSAPTIAYSQSHC